MQKAGPPESELRELLRLRKFRKLNDSHYALISSKVDPALSAYLHQLVSKFLSEKDHNRSFVIDSIKDRLSEQLKSPLKRYSNPTSPREVQSSSRLLSPILGERSVSRKHSSWLGGASQPGPKDS